MDHKKVVHEWYEISLSATHRTLGGKIDEFLEGAPDLDADEDLAAEKFSDNHTVLRDYDGDFDGIQIYSCDITQPLIKFICEKLEINYEKHELLNFRIVG